MSAQAIQDVMNQQMAQQQLALQQYQMNLQNQMQMNQAQQTYNLAQHQFNLKMQQELAKAQQHDYTNLLDLDDDEDLEDLWFNMTDINNALLASAITGKPVEDALQAQWILKSLQK